jgi:hypothetical protein
MPSRYISSIPIILFLISSCQKDITLELAEIDKKTIIVETTMLDNGGTQYIRLTWPSSYYVVDWGRPAPGAQIEVIINDSVFEFINPPDTGFYYNSEISPFLKDNTAHLVIRHEGRIYEAESRWQPVAELDSASIRRSTQLTGLFSDKYDITANFRRVMSEDECYLFNLYMNDSLVTIRPRLRGFLCTNDLENDYVSTVVLSVDPIIGKSGQPLTLEMRSISREFYEFNQAFISQIDWSGNPFAGAPPANYPTNISNGAFGFFQVSSVSRIHFNALDK